MELSIHDRDRVPGPVCVLGLVDARGFNQVVTQTGDGLSILVQRGIHAGQLGQVDTDGGNGLCHGLTPGTLVLGPGDVADDHACYPAQEQGDEDPADRIRGNDDHDDGHRIEGIPAPLDRASEAAGSGGAQEGCHAGIYVGQKNR